MEEEQRRNPIELTQVATSTAPAFVLPDGRVVGMEEYLVWLGNMIFEIKRSVA